MKTDYRIKTHILLTTVGPASEELKEIIKGEISIFCSKLERTPSVEHIYLSLEHIEAIEYEGET